MPPHSYMEQSENGEKTTKALNTNPADLQTEKRSEKSNFWFRKRILTILFTVLLIFVVIIIVLAGFVRISHEMSSCNSICTSLSDINQNLSRVNDELSVLSSRNTPCGSLLSFSIKVFSTGSGLNQAAASCPVHWIGSQGRTYPWKCYYFSEVEGDWNSTQSNCSSLAASLATVDTLEEKEFMLRYQRRSETWIGLTKEADKTWKWVNGTLFNNLFQIRGGGECAYLSDRVISSSRCSTPRHWVCSRPG